MSTSLIPTALYSRHVCNIRDPGLIRLLGDKRLGPHVLRCWEYAFCPCDSHEPMHLCVA